MRITTLLLATFASTAALTAAGGPAIAATGDAPHANDPFSRRPDATIDLRSAEGARLAGAQWRYSDAQVIEVDRAPGADLKPTGAPVKTRDISPRAGALDFDDSAWQILDPTTMEARRTNGRLSFGWYRTSVTIPPKVGELDTTGSTLIFEVVADDYAEVWVDGRLPLVLGGSPALVQGWNEPNRLVIARDVRPGQKIQIALFVANGPLSAPPENYVWLRSATLDFYRPDRAQVGEPVETNIRRMDSALDAIIAPDAKIEKLAGGFTFTEGPLWVRAEGGRDGYLLFSDPNDNTIYRWSPDGRISVYRSHSGYTGADIGRYRQPGSNGLALDAEGRLTVCEHGNRRISRIEKNGTLTVLADRFEGKRLNSPNDLIWRSDGALLFTDPPFGLPGVYDDPAREQEHFGVYCLKDERLSLVTAGLKGPNGIALSPDEKTLYVGNWDEQRKVVMCYDLSADGSATGERVFLDLTREPGEEAIDGVDVDARGNVFVSGPGGTWICSPAGKVLGVIRGPELAANMAFSDDGRWLFLAARSGIYRVALASGPETASARGR